MGHHDTVIVPRCNAGYELFPSALFKVTFRCHKDICRRIKTEKLSSRLPDQWLRDNHDRLVSKSETFLFHTCRHHLKGLARTDAMGKQRIPSKQNTCHRIFLMGL